MVPLILIIEDNTDLLFNLDLMLKSNNYRTLTAKNGKEAIKILTELNEIPDLILSDIMMPTMDGYEFFREISAAPKWHRIPFIFLTAKTSPKEIRLGKLLGADDYVTKPFKEKDLLAIISGKLARVRRISVINEKVEKAFSIMNLDMKLSNVSKKINLTCLIFAVWDDRYGPQLKTFYPKENYFPISMNDIANQLFYAATSIYGHQKITKAEGILLNIENLNNCGYLYFDSYPSENERYGEKQFMLALLAPMLCYLDSLKVKEIFKEISQKVKKNRNWKVREYWERIVKELTYESIKVQPN